METGNRVYKNALGEYADVILHKHRNVIRFNDYGASGNVGAAARCSSALRPGLPHGAERPGRAAIRGTRKRTTAATPLAITAGAIFGVKKSRYDNKDFSVIAVDTACADPNV